MVVVIMLYNIQVALPFRYFFDETGTFLSICLSGLSRLLHSFFFVVFCLYTLLLLAWNIRYSREMHNWLSLCFLKWTACTSFTSLLCFVPLLVIVFFSLIRFIFCVEFGVRDLGLVVQTDVKVGDLAYLFKF